MKAPSIMQDRVGMLPSAETTPGPNSSSEAITANTASGLRTSRMGLVWESTGLIVVKEPREQNTNFGKQAGSFHDVTLLKSVRKRYRSVSCGERRIRAIDGRNTPKHIFRICGCGRSSHGPRPSRTGSSPRVLCDHEIHAIPPARFLPQPSFG